jgi:hypothetical protein
MTARISRVSPHMLRDLQRYSPSTYEQIESFRRKIIPHHFGRLIREGIAAGKIRSDIDPDFAAQFWLQAIRGLIQPDVLDRTQLTPKQTLQKGVNLFFTGLLTPEGRKDYENHSSRRSK